MGTVKGILAMFVWLHLNYEWENFTSYENDDVVSATTTGFLPV